MLLVVLLATFAVAVVVVSLLIKYDSVDMTGHDIDGLPPEYLAQLEVAASRKEHCGFSRRW